MTFTFDPDAMNLLKGLFAEGRLQPASGPAFELTCPSDHTLSLAYPTATAEDVDQVARHAANAVRTSGWADRGAAARAQVLTAWAELIEAEVAHLAALEAIASSRPYSDALARDVRVVASALRTFASYAVTHESAVTATGADELSLVTTEPYGVVAAIAHWNFPMILASWKFAPALAAGNAVILKPSELTPFSALKLAELGMRAGLPAGVFNILPGGAQVGRALVANAHVGYVTFTGSSATGAAIMADAAANGLKPVSLELGGKGAQFVFDDAPDVDKVAELITRGVAYNSGQVCFAGARLVVQSGIKDALLEKVMTRMQALTPGPTWSDGVTLPPIINGAQMERIAGIVDAAQTDGADCLLGGTAMDTDHKLHAYAPTILDRVDAANTAFRQEIFGPVLAVDTFDDFEEGIAKADHPDYRARDLGPYIIARPRAGRRPEDRRGHGLDQSLGSRGRHVEPLRRLQEIGSWQGSGPRRL